MYSCDQLARFMKGCLSHGTGSCFHVNMFPCQKFVCHVEPDSIDE